ncbi:TetR/AcrR family transcriptional regulator [Paenibacillus taihuensis]|nr:TetR/AcrR family transcriptional regulator [Paenibacillus taihuensis]
MTITKNNFQLKRETTYKKLVEAGMKCFSEKGYVGTTLTDIALQTGQTKGAFYGYFASKEELFKHVLEYQMELTRGWTDVPRKYNPANTTLEEVLTYTLIGLSEMLKDCPDWIMVLVDFYQQTKHDKEMQDMLKNKYREWVIGIEQLIIVLKEQGFISKDQETRMTAIQIIAFNEGFTINSVLFGGFNLQALIQGLVKLLR